MLGQPSLGWTSEAAIATGVNRLCLDFGGDLMLCLDVSVQIGLSVAFIIAHLATKLFLLARAFLDMIIVAIKRNMLQTIQTLLHLMCSPMIPEL